MAMAMAKALKVYYAFGLFFIVGASPLKPAFWKGTALDSVIEEMRSSCEGNDTIACFQYRALKMLDSIIQKDHFQLSENVEVIPNNYRSNEVVGRSEDSLITEIEKYIKEHNVKVALPLIGSVIIDSRSLDNNEVDVKLDFSSDSVVEARKKSKLKKIFIPILVFILLKAIILVPFAIGVLGLKAWNGLQLAFFSFIISTGLAIFQMCQKLAADSAHTHITAAAPASWEVARKLIDHGDKIAYSAYAK